MILTEIAVYSPCRIGVLSRVIRVVVELTRNDFSGVRLMKRAIQIPLKKLSTYVVECLAWSSWLAYNHRTDGTTAHSLEALLA